MPIHLLFSCRSCDRPPALRTFPLCEPCAKSLREAPPLCPRCASPRCISRPDLCFGEIDSPLRSFTARYLCIEPGYTVLKSWKKHGGPLFDRIILRPNASLSEKIAIDSHAIIPIPQTFERIRQLGRSPAQIIATRLSRELKIPIHEDFLEWTETPRRGTDRQAQLGLERRLTSGNPFRASHQAMNWVEREKRRRPVERLGALVVDDFMTSGRTLRNAALALQRAGFHAVHSYVLGYRPSQTEVGISESADATAGIEISTPASTRASST